MASEPARGIYEVCAHAVKIVGNQRLMLDGQFPAADDSKSFDHLNATKA